MLIKPNSVIKREEKVQKTIQEKTFILDEKKDDFYELNPTASFVWKNIAKPISFEKLLDNLLKNFDVNKRKAESDLRELLTYLRKKSLISIKN